MRVIGIVLTVIAVLLAAGALLSACQHAFELDYAGAAPTITGIYRATLGRLTAFVYGFSPAALPVWLSDLAGFSLMASALLLRGPVRAALHREPGAAFPAWLLSAAVFGFTLLGVVYALISQRLLIRNRNPDLIPTHDAASAGFWPVVVAGGAYASGLL